MREDLIELILDYCTYRRSSKNDIDEISGYDDVKIPYRADDLKKYTNEYLIKILRDFLDDSHIIPKPHSQKFPKSFSSPEQLELDITAIDNSYSDLGGPDEITWPLETDPTMGLENTSYIGSDLGGIEAGDYLHSGMHYSNWDGGDAYDKLDSSSLYYRLKGEDDKDVST